MQLSIIQIHAIVAAILALGVSGTPLGTLNQLQTRSNILEARVNELVARHCTFAGEGSCVSYCNAHGGGTCAELSATNWECSTC